MSWDRLTGWDKVFAETEKEISFRIEVADVRASGWSLGRTEEDIDKEAARRLKENKGIEYKLPDKKS